MIAVGLAAVVVIQIYLNSTIADWWGSASFGQRRLCSVTLPLVVGNAALLTRLARARLRWLQHAAVVVVFGGLVAVNLSRVWHLRAGAPAPSELAPTCCGGMPGFVAALYDHVGNPFELPASALFAIRHGVSLRRWDRIVGDYPLTPPFGAYRDDTLHGSGPRGCRADEFLVGDWSPTHGGDRPHRTTTHGRVLVPILIPQPTNARGVGEGHARRSSGTATRSVTRPATHGCVSKPRSILRSVRTSSRSTATACRGRRDRCSRMS